MTAHDIAAYLPRRRVIAIGSKVRATRDDHCNSRHEDVVEGYYSHDELWFDHEDYRVQEGDNVLKVPWGLQFCCCCREFNHFKDNMIAELKAKVLTISVTSVEG